MDTISENNSWLNSRVGQSTFTDALRKQNKTKRPPASKFQGSLWGGISSIRQKLLWDYIYPRNFWGAIPVKCHQHGYPNMAWAWHQLTFFGREKLHEPSVLDKNYRQLKFLKTGVVVFQREEHTKCFPNIEYSVLKIYMSNIMQIVKALFIYSGTHIQMQSCKHLRKRN